VAWSLKALQILMLLAGAGAIVHFGASAQKVVQSTVAPPVSALHVVSGELVHVKSKTGALDRGVRYHVGKVEVSLQSDQQSTLRLAPATRFAVSEAGPNLIGVQVDAGHAWVDAQGSEAVQVDFPHASLKCDPGAGAEVTVDAHGRDVMVVRGTAELTTPEGPHQLSTGDSIHLPSK
jgi:hypothetical protein